MLQTKAEGLYLSFAATKKAGVRTSKLLIFLSKKKNALNLSIFSNKVGVKTNQIDLFRGLIPISKRASWIGECECVRAWMN